MISKTQTKETPFIVQHGHCVRDTDVPNDDLQMCWISKWPSDYYVDGYFSTQEEAESYAAGLYLKESVSDRYDLIFEVSVGSKWDEDTQAFTGIDSVSVHDYWVEGLEVERKKNEDIISTIILKVIDLGNASPYASFVLLRALRECMTNSVVGMMTNRDEIMDFIYDKDNWRDEEAYDPMSALDSLDTALRKVDYITKDAFKWEE